MTKNVDEIVVGANGSIFTAPLGSTIPASIAVPLGVAWLDAGYVTEDGVTFTDGKSMESIRAWQSLHDLRRVVTEKTTTLAFSLMQWSGANVVRAFGGGSVEEIVADSGNFRYHPADPAEIDEFMTAVEWTDGEKDYRLVLPRGMATENVETNVTRTAAALLPVTVAVLGSDGVDPFIFDTNDPAFADVAA